MITLINQRVKLAQAIGQWERNATLPLDLVAASGRDCVLCDAYFGLGDNPCAACPVFQATGARECVDTPWGDAYRNFLRWKRDPDNDDARDLFRASAREQVAFLKSVQAGQSKEAA
jgi:hypothetical protein